MILWSDIWAQLYNVTVPWLFPCLQWNAGLWTAMSHSNHRTVCNLIYLRRQAMFAHASLTCLRYQILELTKENLLVGLLQCDEQKLSLTWTPAWTWETQLESSLIILGQKCNAIHFWALPFPDLLLHFARVQLLYCNRPTSKLWQLIRKPQKKAYDGRSRGWLGNPLDCHGNVSF